MTALYDIFYNATEMSQKGGNDFSSKYPTAPCKAVMCVSVCDT